MSLFIVSKNHLVRDLIVASCMARDFIVTEVAETPDQISTLEQADVMLMHTQDLGQRIHNQIDSLHQRQPKLRIIIVTAAEITDKISRALNSKVQALLPENKSADVLMGTLAVVMEGYCVRPMVNHANSTGIPIKTSGLPAHMAKRNADAAQLSPRESIILQKLREGSTNKDIANDLGICQATVKVHLRACYRKIGAKNRTQAAVWASERL